MKIIEINGVNFSNNFLNLLISRICFPKCNNNFEYSFNLNFELKRQFWFKKITKQNILYTENKIK